MNPAPSNPGPDRTGPDPPGADYPGPDRAAPGRAAPAGARIRAQAAFEATTVLRNGEQLLVAIILPALAMLGLDWASVPDLGAHRINVIVPGVLALAVVSTAFTGQAIATAFDRRNGVLRLLGTTPLGRDGLLGAKMIAVVATLAVNLIVLAVIGMTLGWRPRLGGLLPGLVTILLGAACFVALAMVVAGRLRAEAVLAVANLLWVLFLGLGLLLPASTLPAAVARIATWLPSGALGEAMRVAFVDGGWPVGAWLVLLVWAGVAAVVATRIFRWSD
ncbi:MAG: ABC transporter permease [Tetrasphaera sp.]